MVHVAASTPYPGALCRLASCWSWWARQQAMSVLSRPPPASWRGPQRGATKGAHPLRYSCSSLLCGLQFSREHGPLLCHWLMFLAALLPLKFLCTTTGCNKGCAPYSLKLLVPALWAAIQQGTWPTVLSLVYVPRRSASLEIPLPSF